MRALPEKLTRLKQTDFHIRGEPFYLHLEGVLITREIRQQIVDEVMVCLGELLPQDYRGEYEKVTEIEEIFTKPIKIEKVDLA